MSYVENSKIRAFTGDSFGLEGHSKTDSKRHYSYIDMGNSNPLKVVVISSGLNENALVSRGFDWNRNEKKPPNLRLNSLELMDFADTYKDVKTTYAKVLGLEDGSVITKVLLDEDAKIFQKRRFNSAPFEGMDVNVNDIIEIKVFTKPGERKFTYKKIINSSVSQLFNHKKDYFKDLEGSALFQPLPSEDENNL